MKMQCKNLVDQLISLLVERLVVSQVGWWSTAVRWLETKKRRYQWQRRFTGR